jgi:hypothetical protein
VVVGSVTTAAEDDAPQIQAGRVVRDLLGHKITREKADARLLKLGYQFCERCFAHMPTEHVHWSAWRPPPRMTTAPTRERRGRSPQNPFTQEGATTSMDDMTLDRPNHPSQPIGPTPIVTRGLSETELQEIAASVNLEFKRAAVHIIAAGRKLQQAKDRAGYGQFERLFMDHDNPVRNPIRCTARYARQFLNIAQHPVLNRSEHSSVLPHTVRTLYLLSKLPALVVARGIEDAQIRPDMQAHDVKLLKDEAPVADPEERAKHREKREKRRISDTLRRLWQKYPQHRGFYINEVRGLEEEDSEP